jgi:hypothetical protein
MRTKLNIKLYETKCLGVKFLKKIQKVLQAKQIVIKRMRTKINRNRNKRTQSIFRKADMNL